MLLDNIDFIINYNFHDINNLFFLFLSFSLISSIYIFFMQNNLPNAGGFSSSRFNSSGPNIDPQNDAKNVFVAFISMIGIIGISYIVSLSIDYFSIKTNYIFDAKTDSNKVLCETLIELLLIEKNYYNFSSDDVLKPQVIALIKQLDELPLTITFNDLLYIFNDVQHKLDYIRKITPNSSFSTETSLFSMDTKKLYFESINGPVVFKKQTSISLQTQEHYLHILNSSIKALKIKYNISS